MRKHSIFLKGVIASCILTTGFISCAATERESSNSSKKESSYRVQKSGKLIDHVFKVSSDFNSIKSNAFIDIVFTQSSDLNDFVVNGRLPENIIDKCEVKVVDGTLHVSMKSGNYGNFPFKGERPTIYITNRNLKEVYTSGSGDFKIDGSLNASDGLSINSSGSSDFDAGLISADGKDIFISISGAGDVEMKALKCKDFQVNVTGAGDFECKNIASENCTVKISGAGDAEISGNCNKAIFSVSGAGDIKASGLKAATGKATVTGSGDITCSVKNLTKSVTGSGDIRNH